jgi:hypothetical protein
LSLHRAEHRLSVLLVPLALWANGCKEVELGPCFGLLLAEPLEIRIVSEYSAAAGYDFELGRNPAPTRCTTGLRPTPGTSLQVQVVEHLDEDHQSCDSNTVEVKGGSGLELAARTESLAFGTEDEAEILNATHALTWQGCRGSWGFSIESRGSHGAKGRAFVPAPSSGYPPIIMHVSFKADSDVRDSAECVQLLGGERSSCTDYYVVELRRP